MRSLPALTLVSSGITCSLFCALLPVVASPPSDYYSFAEGRSGSKLREALHLIIKGHTSVSYDSAEDALKVLDEDPENSHNLLLIYSGSVAKESAWTKEHLWPQSYGPSRQPQRSDLFNLRPCDTLVNSSRGSKHYDMSDLADRNYNRVAHTNAPLCSADTDSWEPPDGMKGDIARAIFYMDVRYAGEYPSEPDLTLTDDVALITSRSLHMGRLSTLLLWHRIDPVDGNEQRRNDIIFQRYQFNRNPFVDRPEWVELVYLPRLLISHAPLGVVLTWQSPWTNLVVEVSSQVEATKWERIETFPPNSNRISVFFSNAPPSQFFRLMPQPFSP